MKRLKKVEADERQERDAALLKMRFEATIRAAGRKAKTKDWADDLDVDRVPDAKGRVRALITVEDLVRLLDQGLEVRRAISLANRQLQKAAGQTVEAALKSLAKSSPPKL